MAITTYGTLPNLSQKQAVTSKVQRTYGLNFPFGKKSLVGKGYFCKVSGDELIKANILQLLTTKKGERLMLPNYGIDLEKYLFEPLDSLLLSQISEDIQRVIAEYLPEVSLVSLSVNPADSIGIYGIPGISVKLVVQKKLEYSNKIEVTLRVG
jgi:phage baseplate assembly protein W